MKGETEKGGGLKPKGEPRANSYNSCWEWTFTGSKKLDKGSGENIDEIKEGHIG